MKTCTSCGTTFVDTAKFCPKCGTAAPTADGNSTTQNTASPTSVPPPIFSAKTPPPPPPPRAAPKPAQPAAPEPKPTAKKSNTLIIAVVAAVVVIGGIAAVLSSSKKEDTVQQQPQQAIAPQNGQPAVTAPPPAASPPQIPSIESTPQPTASPSQAPNSGLALIPVNDSINFLRAIVQASSSDDEAMIRQAVASIKQLPVPRRGDRKLAREFNDSGLLAFKAEDFANASKLFMQGVEADPSDQELVNNLGYALLMGGKYKEATYVLWAALTLNPERASAWFNQGQSLAMLGKQDAAVASFLLSYRFSKNPQKAKDLMLQELYKQTNKPIIDSLTLALNKLGN